MLLPITRHVPSENSHHRDLFASPSRVAISHRPLMVVGYGLSSTLFLRALRPKKEDQTPFSAVAPVTFSSCGGGELPGLPLPRSSLPRCSLDPPRSSSPVLLRLTCDTRMDVFLKSDWINLWDSVHLVWQRACRKCSPSGGSLSQYMESARISLLSIIFKSGPVGRGFPTGQRADRRPVAVDTLY